MKLIVDTEKKILSVDDGEKSKTIDLYSDEAFELISHEWIRVGWNQKYPYSFSWMGRPIIQLPEDMIRIQEVIYKIKPDVIVETGIAHGGSLIFYSSLCKAMDHGRIIGIDIEIRPHNKKALEEHALIDRVTMIEGSSIDNETIEKVKSLIESKDKVLVILDSNHSYEHVYAEMLAYSDLVTKGSYIVVTDGVMHYLEDVPRGGHNWSTDNPKNAAEDFVQAHNEFVIEQPEWPFNESKLRKNITHWPSAWIKRI